MSIIIENFLNHSSPFFNRIISENDHDRTIMSRPKIILIIFWLICSSILSKCFTSVLLNVYTIKIPSLTVQTLQDIVNNPQLSIAGYAGLKELEHFKPDIYKQLEKRLLDYHKRLGIDLYDIKAMSDRQLQRDLIARKSVVFLGTFATQMLKLKYRESNLMESEEKFSLLFKYSMVSKLFPNYKLVYRLLVYLSCYKKFRYLSYNKLIELNFSA